MRELEGREDHVAYGCTSISGLCIEEKKWITDLDLVTNYGVHNIIIIWLV